MNERVQLECQECVVLTDHGTDTDNLYQPNNDDDESVVADDLAWTEDENSKDSTLSGVFTPCTPLTLSMTECRAQGMYKRRCMDKGPQIV